MLIYSEKEKWYIYHHESTHYQTHLWRYYDIHSICSRGSDSSSKRRLIVKYNQCCIVSTRMVSPRIDYKKVTKGRKPLNDSIKSMNYWRRMIHPKSRIIILNYIITWNKNFHNPFHANCVFHFHSSEFVASILTALM